MYICSILRSINIAFICNIPFLKWTSSLSVKFSKWVFLCSSFDFYFSSSLTHDGSKHIIFYWTLQLCLFFLTIYLFLYGETSYCYKALQSASTWALVFCFFFLFHFSLISRQSVAYLIPFKMFAGQFFFQVVYPSFIQLIHCSSHYHHRLSDYFTDIEKTEKGIKGVILVNVRDLLWV